VRMPICHCSRCHSANTIRVDAELALEHWYCYACGHSFDVPIEDTGHPAGARPRLRSSSPVSLPVKGRSDTGIPSLRVK
jgi:hypothetical protein